MQGARIPSEAVTPSTSPGIVLLMFDQVNAYNTRLLEGIRSVLVPRGLPHVVYAHDPFAHALRAPVARLLQAPGVCGAITTILTDEASHQDMLSTVAASGIPSVHIGAPLAGGTSVGVDNHAGMRALMAHLLDEAGARHIALVRGLEHHPDAAEREEVVRDELAQRGLELPASMVIEGRFDRDCAYTATARLLRAHPSLDAVVALNDRSAVGVLDALADAGLQVPEDVLVSGFDDDVIAQEAGLALTTVSQNLFEQGVQAAQLLLTQLEGAGVSGHHRRPSQLVIRRSSTRGHRVDSHDSGTKGDRPDLARVVAAMERGLAVNRAFMAARDTHQLLEALAESTSRLLLRRAIIVLNLPARRDHAAEGAVVFRHLLGHTHIPTRTDRFPLAEVLPSQLRGLLLEGAWNLQPLSVDSEDLGYVLFEQSEPDQFVGELLRMDLSRALDSLQRVARHAAALEAHAQELEDLVAQRTAELRAEVSIRSAAELELTRANHELRKLSKLDLLTGVANRAGFDEHLEEQWEAHALSGQPLSLLLLDVDHFKQHNDTFGHVTGDAVLRQVGACLRSALWSPRDIGARYGGDEFVALLPDTDADGARAVAQRIQQAVAALGNATRPVPAPTVSIGAATVRPQPGEAATTLVAAADAALYRAKLFGRNQIVA